MEIKKPNKRTFWKADAGIEGVTETFQVTTSPHVLESSENASTLFPALPNSGMLTEGDIYSYNSGMVIVRQTHERTQFPPEETPALFSVYRANTEGAEWVANEEVIAGDTRTFDGNTYECIQSHTTQEGWQPPNVPALWKLVVQQTDEWQAGVSYTIGDVVVYQGVSYECRQSHTSQVGWEPPNVPALWLEV